MKWKYYQPNFEYEETFQDTTWPWAGHKFFAYDFVRNIKPKVIVELGTHYGTSFFSFCQAAKDGKLNSELYAVDTWKGDEQAGNYGEEVIETVKKIKKNYYSDLKINLLRKTFDEALDKFKDDSIDFLHIDGLHTYEAVKHDLDTWFSKVKEDGIIIFHDISEKHGDFGVYKLWDEIKERYKTLEFHHSHGLGIMFKKNGYQKEIFNFQEIWQHYYLVLSENKRLKVEFTDSPKLIEEIEDKVQRIKEKNVKIRELKRSNKEKEVRIKEYEKIVQDREKRINEVVNSLRWKVPNFFYKLYKKKLKKFVPRFIFRLKDVFVAILRFFNNNFIRATIKYLKLSKLAWEEYRITGWGGLKLAIERHYKKINAENISYPKVDDYIKNLVSIGILTKDRIDLIKPCIDSIMKYPSEKYKFVVLIGDTGTTDKKVLQYYKHIMRKYKNIRLVKFKKYFFSKNYNDLMTHARGQYLVFLNNDTVVKDGWLDNLIDPLKDKKVGIVGGKLLYKNGTIQHAGVEVDTIGQPYHIHSKEKSNFPKTSYKAIVPSVTFACVATRHDVFNRFKLDESYREESQDTDFSFRLHKAGFQILYNPEVEIYHLECSSRDWRKGEEDRKIFNKKWAEYIQELVNNHQNQRVKYDKNQYKDTITVIRDDGIGDLLMCVSSFSKLRKKYPDKKLILATYERNIEMMQGFGIFDEFIPIPNGQKYTPLPIPKKSKVYNLVSFEMKVTATQGIPTEDNKIHRHLVFAKTMELNEKYEPVKMPDYTEAGKLVEKLFKDLGIDINQKFVVLNLVSTNPARSWWEPYYPKLIEVIEKMGFIPIIVGTKDSEYYRGKRLINLVGKTKTIAEFIEVVKLGKYVISTDTSAYHIAALSNIPFLAIFTGGVLPEARLKYYSNYEVLEPPKSLKCYPCWDEGCEDPRARWQKDPCRLIIKPEQVIEKFKNLVKKYPAK